MAGPPTRVLFVDHIAQMSGGEVALFNLVRHLDRARYEPLVLLYSDGPLRAKLAAAGIETHVHPLPPALVHTRKDSLHLLGLLRRATDAARVAGFAARQAAFVRRHRVGLVHTNSLKADVIGGLSARLAGRPLVWHVRDRIEPDYMPHAAAIAFRWLCRLLPDAVIANSTATLETLRLTSAQRAAVIPSGVDLRQRARVVLDGAVHPGSASPPTMAPSRTPTPPTPPTVGIVGRLARWKGQHVFLRAARWVHQQFPDARFQIIGSALFDERAYEDELRRLVLELGLGGVVEFTGFRDDAAAAVAALTVVVHASVTPEPFGQVVVEGMAQGKPVVATAGGGVMDLVDDGVTGLLVPMGDAEAMAVAVARLLADPVLAARMGSLAEQRVRERFTIDRTARHVELVYDRLLNRPAWPRRWAAGVADVDPGAPDAARQTGWRVAGAVTSVAAATAVSAAVQWRWGDNAPLLGPYIVAVAGTARVWGTRVGLATLALAAVAVDVVVLRPRWSFAHAAADTPRLWMFAAVATAVVAFLGQLHEATACLRAAATTAGDAKATATRRAAVTAALSMAADPAAVADTLAYLITRQLAPWCAVDLRRADGTMARAAVAAAHPSDAEAARSLAARSRTPAGASDPAGDDLARQVGGTASLTLPINGPGHPLGRVTCVRTTAGADFGPDARQLLEEFCAAASIELQGHRVPPPPSSPQAGSRVRSASPPTDIGIAPLGGHDGRAAMAASALT